MDALKNMDTSLLAGYSLRKRMKDVPFDYVPKSTKDFNENCLPNKAWRLNNLYRIKDKKGKKIKFRMRPEQWEVFHSKHPKKLILKARQLGMTTFIQIDMLDDCLFKENLNAAVIAHVKSDAESFFRDKIKFAYDNFFPELIEIYDDFKLEGNSASALYFGNKSRIIVTISGRSGTNQKLHISEYGKLCAERPDRAKEVQSGALNTVDVDMEVTIESTAEGKIGHFYELCMKAFRAKQQGDKLTKMDYEFFFFPWFDDPTYVLDADFEISTDYELYFSQLEEMGITLRMDQKRWYVKKSEEQGDKMKQEYPSYVEEAFQAAVNGSYFHKQMAQIRKKKQICRVPIEPGIPIYTFWDLGRDTTAIWFFQEVGMEWRMVDYFENDSEDMAYFVNVLRTKTDGGRPYLYGAAFLPHDGDRKTMVSKRITPETILYSNGFDVQLVRKTNNKGATINRARLTIPKLWFDKDKCAAGITHLDNYRKAWDDKLENWKKEPVHDKASHGADAFMTFSDGYYREESEEDERPSHHKRSATGY